MILTSSCGLYGVDLSRIVLAELQDDEYRFKNVGGWTSFNTDHISNFEQVMEDAGFIKTNSDNDDIFINCFLYASHSPYKQNGNNADGKFRISFHNGGSQAFSVFSPFEIHDIKGFVSRLNHKLYGYSAMDKPAPAQRSQTIAHKL